MRDENIDLRKWSEINEIKKDFDQFKSTRDKKFIQKYQVKWNSIIYLIDNSTLSTESLAIFYWYDQCLLPETEREKWRDGIKAKLIGSYLEKF